MLYVVTTWNWQKTGKPHCETLEIRNCFQDMDIGETRLNYLYAITRLA